ncbi:secernin-2 isoform X2 [Callorhinchus milii]|uniref:secernin-2 isoform X2 n=1 Tax=Callorhinchus milii TaxID=7868 RepID=UPI001C3F65A5|nr:secernin-2 isoform X2 [Callorhinchus milii]
MAAGPAQPPCSCDSFVALPPSTKGRSVIFGKNSDRSQDEVQEVIYFGSATYEEGSKLECTYIEIEQAAQTFAVIISRPAWLWGAEMGANEHGVCIGNEGVWTREPISDREALLGMDLVRLGLERGSRAEEAMKIIVSLLEKYEQGGNCVEEPHNFSYHNSFMIVDRQEAWLLETAGKYWAAQKITEGVKNISNQLSITTDITLEHPELRSHALKQGWWDGHDEFIFSQVYSSKKMPSSKQTMKQRYLAGKQLLENHEAGTIEVESMIDILRDKDSGICMCSGSYCTTGSMVSLLPRDKNRPCIHFFTATPDPSRSIFKPFAFGQNTVPVPMVKSPSFGSEDPVKQHPRFQSKPDRRHDLYKAHEKVLTDAREGVSLRDTMRHLEKQGLDAIMAMMNSNEDHTSEELMDMFFDCVEAEMNLYK